MTQKLSDRQALRYSRQILIPGFDLAAQEKLLNARVLQIGVGGLGCAAAQYTVASGVGALTLVDDDQVSLSNLQRQILHSEATLGQDKVDSALAQLAALNSDCELRSYAQRFSEAELLAMAPEYDLILDCCDNLETRNSLNRVSVATGIPLVTGAAIRGEGQVACFVPSTTTPCYQCLSQFFAEQSLSCMESGILSPVVGIIGAMQALVALKCLTGFGDAGVGQVQLFDALTGQWRQFNLPKSPQCPVCGEV